MYQAHFGFKKPVFERGIAQDAAVFMAAQHEAIVANSKVALTTFDSAVVLTGAAGVGKTTLMSAALRTTSTRLALGWLTGSPGNGAELLELLLVELGFNAHRVGRVERMQMWRQFLNEMSATSSRVYVIAERAEDLSPEVLRALDSLTAADPNGSLGANLVLLGQPTLNEHLKSPVLGSLRQRIRLRQQLDPLDAVTLRGYLDHQVKLAGGELDKVFAPNAFAALHRYSAGIPRVANNLCETALQLAANDKQPTVTAELLTRVAIDLFGMEPEVRETSARVTKETSATVGDAVSAASTTAATIDSSAPVAPFAAATPRAAVPLPPAATATPAASPMPSDSPTPSASPMLSGSTAPALAMPMAPASAPSPPLTGVPATLLSAPAHTPASSTIWPSAQSTVSQPPAVPAVPASPAAQRAVAAPSERGSTMAAPPPPSGDVPVVRSTRPLLAPRPDPAPAANGERRFAPLLEVAPPAPASPTPPPSPGAVGTSAGPKPSTARSDVRSSSRDDAELVFDVDIDTFADTMTADSADVAMTDFPVLTDAIEPLAAPRPRTRAETAYVKQPVSRATPATPAAKPAAALPRVVAPAPPPARDARPAFAPLSMETKPLAESPAGQSPAAEPGLEDGDELRQTQTMRALAAAKSIDDISNSMAETLFGEADLDMLSAALASAGWSEDETPTLAPIEPEAPAASSPPKAAPATAARTPGAPAAKDPGAPPAAKSPGVPPASKAPSAPSKPSSPAAAGASAPKPVTEEDPFDFLGLGPDAPLELIEDTPPSQDVKKAARS